jgi:putative MFS transporter
MGRADEAHAILVRFGAALVAERDGLQTNEAANHGHSPRVRHCYARTTLALTLVALVWGFVNFGVLLWLPSSLIAEGHSVGVASTIITKSTLLAAPTIIVVAYLYGVWSTKWSLIGAIGITTLGLLSLIAHILNLSLISPNLFVPLVLLIVGSTGVISILLPYAAENHPLKMRSRATGLVAACSKLGGLLVQGLSVIGLAPRLGIAAMALAVAAGLSLALIAISGRETLGCDLREVEPLEARQC